MGPALAVALPLIAQGVQSLLNNSAADKQQENNMEIAKFQASANEKYLHEQMEYNTPKNQMLRYQDAGLNPNLIYGQGNPGSQSAPLSYPNVQAADYQRTPVNVMQAIPLMNQTRLADSQINAQTAQTIHQYAMTELNNLQARVLEKNPLLDDAGFKAIIDGLKGSAQIKLSEGSMKSAQADWTLGNYTWKGADGQNVTGPLGAAKLQREMDVLNQKFNLNAVDQSIKAQILKSKEFQNAILEVQKKFMTDGDITPQHILQFIQLLLMKML